MSKGFLNIGKVFVIGALVATTGIFFTGCGSNGEKTAKADGAAVVKVGVVGGVAHEIWKTVADEAKKDNVDLEIVDFSDYVTPNNALNSGDIDLNAFQHQIFLDDEVKQKGYKIEAIGTTYVTPLNLYSNKVKKVSEIKEGDIVAIPDDVTNGGRALKVLEGAGLIKLDENAEFSPRVKDIKEYIVPIKIEELKANTITAALPDVTAAIINGNYALDQKIPAENIIYNDQNLGDKQYWNLIVARTDDLKDENKKAVYDKVVKAYQSEPVKKLLLDKYKGAFILAGWGN